MERFVCFLDVLGFSDSVYDEKDETVLHLKSLLLSLQERNRKSSLESVQKVYGLSVTIRNSITSFSDSIFIVTPEIPEDVVTPIETQFSFLLNDICAITSMLLEYGYLVRGAIGYGVYNDEGSIGYGKPHVEAVNAEKSYCIYPRVVLCSSVIKLFSGNNARSLNQRMINRDFDGIYYVNWLGGFPAKEPVDLESVHMFLMKNLELHRNEKIFAKWAWMTNYINQHVHGYIKFHNKVQEAFSNKKLITYKWHPVELPIFY